MPQQLPDIIAITPFETPDPGLAVAACAAGALGVLDVGRDAAAIPGAVHRLAALPQGSAGVRVPQGVGFDAALLPPAVGTVIVVAGDPLAAWRGRRVLVEVTSLAEAQAAIAAGAAGLIAKGHEAGGRVGEETSFVLLQALATVTVPVWVQGGVGLHTAAACIAGGAAGVVLDAQLALLREATLPAPIRAALAAMDGSETTIVGGHRVFTRPDLPLAELAAAADVRTLLGARDLQTQLLPAGQDAAFAQSFAQRFRTVAGVVRGLRAAIAHDLPAARRQRALAADAPLARDLRLRYPIFQGPMTRVSDRAAFAADVADAGGLPFLALALMRGPEVEAVLAETAERLAGRTWGVGILGFVPAELREEQLEVVRRIKPPVALIAGGRPAQARPLEELGIATFLHTPSPGLLDLFLKQGARRFVFEGAECGGHVGPRTSFVLWEQQIARLLAHPAPAELDIVFAGGIHDGRSAAMVAAMAAPLVERGAKVGVLMGTAYLFTHEAVAAGAIQPAFQQAALACRETVLLETAPGHATRCADTAYVQRFRAERERLQAAGVPAQAMWQELEELNLGRLRIAAKGLRRDGDALVRVDADAQLREGMVMLGQVAALRSDVTSVAALHAEVADGSLAQLATLSVADAGFAPAPQADIAIVGMATILPGAPDLEHFWANIVNGVNSVREVPAERWRIEEFFDPASLNGEMTPSKWGGFLDPYPFDPLTYGIPPTSLAAIEPVQLLALEASRKALVDAGYGDRPFDRENTAVIFGAEAGTDLAGAYGFRAQYRQYAGALPPALDAVLPRLTEDSFPGILSNVISGRIANRLDLGGANYTVDAACASSLAAVDLACKELANGDAGMVICGGADLHNSIVDYLVFASVHALSPSGQCRTFDAAADGIALGEGVAAIVLKRLADAERDGDRIYAVIKGVGSGSDGKSLGLTAPRTQGQQRTLARAYRKAGVAPAEVGLVEAHGTGTVVGDRTELETLNGFFAGAGAPAASIALGSIKSQIGHTKCTAGVAGLIKAALALHHRVLPPTLNITAPNPGWTPASPFTLSTAARPWPGRARKAGVSAFGFGGTNFHAVLAEYEGADAEAGVAPWPAELFLVRGTDRAEALRRIDALEGAAARGHSLRDLARSTASGTGVVHYAIVAHDHDDLLRKIALARAGTRSSSGVFVAAEGATATPGPIAFLFPGQGSQRIGMLGDLFIAFPQLQRHLAAGARWADAIFPPTAWSPEAAEAQRRTLTDTRVTQPALGVANLALADLLAQLGVRPAMLAGHSYGELVALAAAGAIPEADLPALSELRGRRILDTCTATGDTGTMAAVAADAATIAPFLVAGDGVVIANENAPDQCVLSGPTAAVEAAVARLRAAGVGAKSIPVACAFHSPLARAAGAAFAADLARVAIAPPTAAVYSNTTAGLYPADPARIRALLAEHIGEPVRFAAEIEAMYAAGARIFVEAGPGRVLTGLVGKVLGARPHVAVACDRAGEHGVVQLLLALGELAVHGVPIDVERLFAGRKAARFDLAAAPEVRPSASAWWINGQRAWPMHGELPANAMRPVATPLALHAASGAGPVDGDRQAVVLEYLRNMREMVDTQRRVMMGFLGAADAPARVVIDADVVQPAVAAPAPPAASATPAASTTSPGAAVPPAAERDVAQVLLAIVAQRTGYPPEMLDLDLDLEADLSIDSIKRVEILGAVAERLGAGSAAGAEELPENLVAIKTLRGIIEALRPLVAGAAEADAAVPAGAPAAASAPVAVAPPASAAAGEAAGAIDAPVAAADPEPIAALARYVVELQPIRRANGAWSLSERQVGIVGAAPPLEGLLLDGLQAAGSSGHAQRSDVANGRLDALVDLSPMRADWSSADVPALFTRLRHALVAGASHVLVGGIVPGPGADGATGADEAPSAGGVPGMIKSLRKEWPDRQLRMAYFLPRFDNRELAQYILDELNCADDAGEVAYSRDGLRTTPRIVRADRSEVATGDAQVTLGPESVVLVTGGARGITARISLELARRYRCTLVLVGRSPAPAAPEDDDIAAAPDEKAVRQALIARGGGRKPAEIEAQCARVMAAREIRATLAGLAEAGATPHYHAVDVRDAKAFGAVIDGIYATHGRLDGVIHGAGVIEDKLARDKTPESFARVFETKVNGALAIARHVRKDIGFIVFFSSISATFGNRGQSDYAAANDFLDRLAAVLQRKLSARVLSINWGPWGGAGMVSPELTREYAKRGIGLIDPEAGAADFFAELLHGSATEAQVILMRGDPAALR